MTPVSQYVFDGARWRNEVTTRRTSATAATMLTTTWRDVHLNGPEYGLDDPTAATQSFSQNRRGSYDTDYHYESQPSLSYLAARGVRRVKIPIRWERINPVLGGALDATELGRLRACLDRCHAAGLKVLVDIHNYGVYYVDDPAVSGTSGTRRALGSTSVPVAAFSSLWKLLATALRAHPAVANGGGYAIMAEPQGAGGLTRATWRTASQAAVTAIRGVDLASVIHVAGWDWSICQDWASVNGTPWITDPAHNFRYECHHYWDATTGGSYDASYARELATAQAGYSRGGYVDALQNRILTELSSYASWLSTYGVRGIVGELGWPAAEAPAQWNALAEVYLRRCDELKIDTVFWSAGEWAYGGPADMLVYTGSPLSTRNTQAPVYEAHRTFG
jgi:hypothetical protein